MDADSVLNLYNSLERLGIEIWLDGGWGVDALLEEQTRAHKDLDIVIQQKDVDSFRQHLENWGYKEVKLEIARPHNFGLADDSRREVDVHVIVFDEDGNGIYGPSENSEMYPSPSLTGSGAIKGQRVRCISAEWSVKFHGGYRLQDKDYNDVFSLCRKFNLVLPEEYKEFEKSFAADTPQSGQLNA